MMIMHQYTLICIDDVIKNVYNYFKLQIDHFFGLVLAAGAVFAGWVTTGACFGLVLLAATAFFGYYFFGGATTAGLVSTGWSTFDAFLYLY